MSFAFIFVVILLLAGIVLRQRIAVCRWLYIPASVIAGLVGLIVIQSGLLTSIEASVYESPVTLAKTLSDWPGWLIAVVFAGMLLERGKTSAREGAVRVGQQGLMVWVIVLGETAVGLLATWLIVQPFYDVPNSAGMLIETGFAGGHGTAAAMGEVFQHPSVDFPSGRDLGMLMATCGLVYGIVTGILWINLGVRRGWVTPRTATSKQAAISTNAAANKDDDAINRNVVDPLLLQVIWLTLAVGIGMLGQAIVLEAAGAIDAWRVSDVELDAANEQLSQRLSVTNVVDFPLFIYTLFGGLIVRRLLTALKLDHYIRGATISRLTSIAMDILVVAAIASLNLQAVAAMLVPFTILFVCGGVWAAICLLVISRMLLPREHWFELGLINYGMSTGTTATGFVLLRMVDPELKSGAAEDYALAAPLSAPFIGGGMITIALPLLVLEQFSIAFPAIIISLVVAILIATGRLIANRR